MNSFKILILIFLSTSLCGQNRLPNLEMKNSIDFENDVQKKLRLKKNDIAVSFYTNGGMMYHLNIDNFIFKENGDVLHYKEEVYFKNGKKHKRKKIVLTPLKKEKLKEIIQSDLFRNYSKYTQTDYRYSENSHQICSTTYINDAPENFLMITQNMKQSTIMVYLPKNNINCSLKDSPLMKFVELYNLFGIPIER